VQTLISNLPSPPPPGHYHKDDAAAVTAPPSAIPCTHFCDSRLRGMSQAGKRRRGDGTSGASDETEENEIFREAVSTNRRRGGIQSRGGGG
jgi:hypothetical protein